MRDPNGAIELTKLQAAPLVGHPFDHVIVPRFLNAQWVEAINDDFPDIRQPGSFPAQDLRYGAAFGHFLEALRGAPLRHAFAEKFAIDLEGRPETITIRGQAQTKDGRVHTDSNSKLLTVLIYMNPAWESDAGRLRLLSHGDDLDDFAVEVPPEEGTLIAFRNGPTAFHGHKPLTGQRRSIQLNWVTNAFVLHRERLRHGISARLKSLTAAFA